MDEKRKVTQEELDNICILHNKFIEDEDGGELPENVRRNCQKFTRFPRLPLTNRRISGYNGCVKIDCPREAL